MTDEQLWTVARFPDGSWSTGGEPSDPCYSGAEVYVIAAKSRDDAERKARRWRAMLNQADQK